MLFSAKNSSNLFTAIISGNVEQVKNALMVNVGDLNTQDAHGKTPLIQATEYSFVNIVLLLLAQNGIDLDIQDNDGNTALHKAYALGNETIKQALLGAGADSEILNNRQEKPSDFGPRLAVYKEQKEMAAVYAGPPEDYDDDMNMVYAGPSDDFF